MRLISSLMLSVAILLATACGNEKNSANGTSSDVAPDGFDAAFCQTVRNTAAADLDTAMISRMVEQAKILKPMFEPGAVVKFANADDSTTRHNAYDDVSGKLYELVILNRIDRTVIDQINGYEQIPLPE